MPTKPVTRLRGVFAIEKRVSPPGARSRRSSRRRRGNAEDWGKLEFEETKIGRLDHKIEKLKIIKGVPGVEWLRPEGTQRRPRNHAGRIHTVWSHGRVTPHPFDSHAERQHREHGRRRQRSGVQRASWRRQMRGHGGPRLQRGDISETGIENIACMIEKPTLDSFKAICKREGCGCSRHRRPGGRQGGDEDRQARDLRRAGQPACAGG